MPKPRLMLRKTSRSYTSGTLVAGRDIEKGTITFVINIDAPKTDELNFVTYNVPNECGIIPDDFIWVTTNNRRLRESGGNPRVLGIYAIARCANCRLYSLPVEQGGCSAVYRK